MRMKTALERARLGGRSLPCRFAEPPILRGVEAPCNWQTLGSTPEFGQNENGWDWPGYAFLDSQTPID